MQNLDSNANVARSADNDDSNLRAINDHLNAQNRSNTKLAIGTTTATKPKTTIGVF
jgi:hypothetical protein